MTGTPARIDMSGTHPRWPGEVRALWRVGMAREAEAPDVWDSASRQGDPGLREVLAALLGDRPERVAVTSGVRSSAGVLSRSADRVVHECPTFAGTVGAFRDFGTPVTLANWDRMADAVGDESTERVLLWVTRPLRNPDGATLDTARWRRLRALGSDRLRVVVNEVYRWHSRRAPPPDSEADPDAPVTAVGSLAKLAGTGSALGWIRAPDVRTLIRFHPSRPPLLWQRCWRYLLERGALEMLVAGCVQPARDAARVFLDELAVADRPPEPPPFVLLTVAGLDTDGLVARLAEDGITAGPGADFLVAVPAVRLAFAGLTPTEAERAASVVRRRFAGRYRLLVPGGDREDQEIGAPGPVPPAGR